MVRWILALDKRCAGTTRKNGIANLCGAEENEGEDVCVCVCPRFLLDNSKRASMRARDIFITIVCP